MATLPSPKPRPARLTRQVQCRFNDAQFDLVQHLADEVGRPISAVVRDIVNLWAIGYGTDESIEDEDSHGELLDVARMVADLEAVDGEDLS
jgi:hypothetical protein